MSDEKKSNIHLIGEIFVEGEAPPQYYQAFLNAQEKAEEAAAQAEEAAGRAEAAAAQIEVDQEFIATQVFAAGDAAEVAATAARNAAESEQKTKDDADRAEGAARCAVETAGYITPQMHGAKGDGVTDDTDAIREARAVAIEKKKALYFPAGTYLIRDSIELWSGAEIYGCGEKSVIKKIHAVTQELVNPDSLVAGQTTVTVADASKYAVGQGCYIGLDDSTADWCTHGVITAIDKSRNTITFEAAPKSAETGITGDTLLYWQYLWKPDGLKLYFSTSFPVFCTYRYKEDRVTINNVVDVNLHDLCLDGNTQVGEARSYANSVIHIDAMKSAHAKNVDGKTVDFVIETPNEHIRIDNVTIINSIGDGISLQSVKNASVTNCTIKNSKHNGIHVGVGSEYVYIGGNKVFDCDYCGYFDCASLTSVSVTGNAFVECRYGIGGLDMCTRGYSIDGNNFERCGVGVLCGETPYQDHTCSFNKAEAVSTQVNGIIISNNSFHGHHDELTDIGISLKDGMNAAIQGNTFRHLGKAIDISKAKNFQFKNNVVVDCATTIAVNTNAANQSSGGAFIGNTVYAGMTGTSAAVTIANVNGMLVKDNILNGIGAALTTADGMTKADNIVLTA